MGHTVAPDREAFVAVENAQLNQQKEVKAHDNYHDDMEYLWRFPVNM